jgi:hypothetical protein
MAATFEGTAAMRVLENNYGWNPIETAPLDKDVTLEVTDGRGTYVVEHKLDGFVVEEKAYFLKSSTSYQANVRMPNSIAAERSRIHA